MESEDTSKASIRKNLNKLILKLTDDGKLDLESIHFQFLKSEVQKRNVKTTELIVKTFLETAKRSGCPDRLLILHLIDWFFGRSRQFRENILNDPVEFLELMLETDPIRQPLPGSKKQAKKLKTEAIQVVKQWENHKFANKDARMKCIIVTLKRTKFVNFESADVDFEAEKKRKERILERRKKMLENALSAYKSKFEQIRLDADRIFKELDTCMNLLVPSFLEFSESLPSTSSSRPSESLEIVIPDLAPEVIVSHENDALVEAFLDAKLLLTHRVQTLRKLIKRLKVLQEPGEKLSEEITEYRESLKRLVLKAEELKVTDNRKRTKKKRTDDDWIDVEISIDDILMVQYSKKTEKAMEKEREENEKKEEEKEEKKVEETVKTVPFGLDLKYWGEEREDVQVPKNNADCHRFWRSSDEPTSSNIHRNIYTQRQFTFIGEPLKSDKVCRARLPNGSLCPRKDFQSCPLHGSIVDRDEKGDPITEEDRREERKREERKRKKEEEEFSRQIEKQFEKKTNKRQKKHHVETTPAEDVRSRLQKKLFDPKAIQRVSAVLDASRKNRLQNTFGHQFSHM